MRAYERLLHYVTFDTASDPESPTCPSTDKQKVLGADLVHEMKTLGIRDAFMDEHGYVYGTVPATPGCEHAPVVGFIAHMDTVSEVPHADIKARVVKDYDGGDLELNAKEHIVVSAKEFPEMRALKGKDLIVTDGTTLLGADDKAGIAEILTMAETLLGDPKIPHGTVKIGFTPDEEIGRGANLFDVKGFGADFAYTVDGGAFGAVDYECFNAASLKVRVIGKNIHPGSAKNKMKNASLIAAEFIGMLPPCERPEHTEMYEGFYHLCSMAGNEEHASLGYILRDHDAQKLEDRKAFVRRAADYLNAVYGAGTVELEIKDGYRNMSEVVSKHMHLIDNAKKAIEAVGGKPFSTPVRGGTDGAVLCYMGLPCPNLGTGGGNFHGRLEYACVQSMDQCTAAMVEIARLYGGMKR